MRAKQVVFFKQGESDFESFNMKDVVSLKIGRAENLFPALQLKGLGYRADEQVAVVNVLKEDGIGLYSHYFSMDKWDVGLRARLPKQDIKKIDDALEYMIESGRRDSKKHLSFISCALTSYDKTVKRDDFIKTHDDVYQLPEELRYDHWEMYGSDIVQIFLTMMVARFVPKDDLQKLIGRLPEAMLNLLTSYKIFRNGDNSVVDKLEDDNVYYADMDILKSAMEHACSLTEDLNSLKLMKKLKECRPHEFMGIAQTFIDGLLFLDGRDMKVVCDRKMENR